MHASGRAEPLSDMLDEDKEASQAIKYAFGDDTSFYRAIIRHGPWARALAKAMNESSTPAPGHP